MRTLFTVDGLLFLLRWGHYLAGITWIGLLYYFNFIQGEWFKETDAGAKTAAVQKLVPRVLWWFRWGAMGTFLTGAAILGIRYSQAGAELLNTSWSIFILTGAAMGTFMFLNVWLIIWPNQKIVIANASGQPNPNAAAAGAKAGLASRTNTLFSIPLLFFMGAASHLPLNLNPDFNGWVMLVALAVIIGGLELNGIIGKTGIMTSVKGVIGCGFALIAVLYTVISVLA